jgi:hypothetical protein
MNVNHIWRALAKKRKIAFLLRKLEKIRHPCSCSSQECVTVRYHKMRHRPDIGENYYETYTFRYCDVFMQYWVEKYKMEQFSPARIQRRREFYPEQFTVVDACLRDAGIIMKPPAARRIKIQYPEGVLITSVLPLRKQPASLLVMKSRFESAGTFVRRL